MMLDTKFEVICVEEEEIRQVSLTGKLRYTFSWWEVTVRAVGGPLAGLTRKITVSEDEARALAGESGITALRIARDESSDANESE